MVGLKSLIIQLSGPVCGCEIPELMWWLEADSGGNADLFVRCKICKAQIYLPYREISARISMDELPFGPLGAHEPVFEPTEKDREFLHEMRITDRDRAKK